MSVDLLAQDSGGGLACVLVVVVVIVIVIVAAIIAAIAQSRAAGTKVMPVRSRSDFHADDVYVSTVDQNGLAIERATSRLLLVRGNVQQIVNADQIVSVEVMADDSALVKTNRGSQVAGAAVGAVLLGPVGLLLGGLTGSKRTENRIKRIRLRIVTNDFNYPTHDILLYQSASNKGDTRDSILLREPLAIAERWHGRVTSLIHQVAAAHSSGPASGVGIVADELRKLADLRDEGLLTPEEFAAQKRLLLGSD